MDSHGHLAAALSLVSKLIVKKITRLHIAYKLFVMSLVWPLLRDLFGVWDYHMVAFYQARKTDMFEIQYCE